MVLLVVSGLGGCVTLLFFFFNDTATTEIYTLSLHDALPIFALGATLRLRSTRGAREVGAEDFLLGYRRTALAADEVIEAIWRSEEHTSELQSRQYLVCRLLLEKKKPNTVIPFHHQRTRPGDH